MRFFTLRMFLLAVLLLVVGKARCDEKIVYDGICFTLQINREAYVEPLEEGHYSGNVVIPESFRYGESMVLSEEYTVVGIEPDAFRNCEELVSVSIPKTVTETIDATWFNGSTSLEAINVDSDNTKYASVDGALYYKKQKELIRVPEGKSSITLSHNTETTWGSIWGSIGKMAFWNCRKLTSITLPTWVSDIRDGAFDGCTSLTEINVEESNWYSSVNGVLYNSQQSEVIRVPEGVESIEFPDELYFIGKGALKGCRKLESVTLPPNLLEVEDSVFKGCTGLTSITIPKYVDEIGRSAFEGCVNLASVEFPSSLKDIGYRAFYGCANLSSVVLPASVGSISSSAFTGCTGLKTAIVLSEDIDWGFEGSGLEKIYYVHPKAIIRNPLPETYTGIIYGTQEVLDQFTSPSCMKIKWFDLDTKLGALSFSNICDESQFEVTSCSRLQGNGLLAEEYEVRSTDEGGYKIEGLLPGKTYQVTVHASLDGISMDLPITVETLNPMVDSPKITECTQTTVKLTFSVPTDDTCRPANVYVRYELPGGGYYDSGNLIIDNYESGTCEAVISGLRPGREYGISVSASYENGEDYSSLSSRQVTCSTSGLFPNELTMELHPTSVKITGTYTKGDATILTAGYSRLYDNMTLYRNELPANAFEVYQDGQNTVLEVQGLQPDQKHCFWYFIETEEGGKDSLSYEFTTPELELTTLPAKATSNTVALICAETNLSDMETGAGFEWRRYDAPDEMPSTQSPCPVVDSVLTGALRNLSENTYYKFRPYYTSASGQTYYGEWSAFITADAYVYFDPTVRTYEATGVTETEAHVRGYAIAGSDDITEQGFEYWAEDDPVKRSATEVRRVQVSGQFMTATLEDLQPNTTYTFRVYVETAKGTTYGEEQTFTTVDDGTGVFGIGSDDEIGELKVAVCGNLSEGSASVKVSSHGEEARWTLTGIGGAVAALGSVRADGTWQTLDAPALPHGLYLLTVYAGEAVKTIKLLTR